MTLASSKLNEENLLADFDIHEFSERWRRARISALKKSLDKVLTYDLDHMDNIEMTLLRSAPKDSRALILKTVFDHSRQFGLSAAKHFKLTFEIQDLAKFIPHLGSPCFHGLWQVHNEAQVLRRSHCEISPHLGSFGCDYWKEALDGLVVGVGENERYTRHQSQGYGDAECVDVLYEESFVLPRIIAGNEKNKNKPNSHKYGEISTEIELALAPIRSRFSEMRINLVLEGLSERKLYYRLDAADGVLCGAGGRLLHNTFANEVFKAFPDFTVVDSSPLAVYGSER